MKIRPCLKFVIPVFSFPYLVFSNLTLNASLVAVVTIITVFLLSLSSKIILIQIDVVRMYRAKRLFCYSYSFQFSHRGASFRLP